MQIKAMALGPVQTNCYWLLDEDSMTAMVIDPGAGPGPVLASLAGYRVERILLTHGHWDHIAGVQALKDATGAPVCIAELEQNWLTDPELNRSAFWPQLFPEPIRGPAADRLLREGDTFAFGDLEFRAVHTPGHTPGSLSFVVNGVVFAGDTLFQGSIGRTDLPGGSLPDLLRTIRTRLFALPEETRVAPGHGPLTTIGRERVHNPFVGAAANTGA